MIENPEISHTMNESAIDRARLAALPNAVVDGHRADFDDDADDA